MTTEDLKLANQLRIEINELNCKLASVEEFLRELNLHPGGAVIKRKGWQGFAGTKVELSREELIELVELRKLALVNKIAEKINVFESI